jgi:hypothetical protein
MKFRIAMWGVLCLAGFAQGQTGDKGAQQSADRMKAQAAAVTPAPQAVKGCVDEENGHYVLRDNQSGQLVHLKAVGTNADNDFARFVGNQAQASGTMSAGTMTVAHIGQVADMCPVVQ